MLSELASVKLLLKFSYGFQNHMAHDSETPRAYLIERILRRVPVFRLLIAVPIDDVDYGHVAFEEWLMIVCHFQLTRDKNILVAQLRCLFPHQFRKPPCGISFARNCQSVLADHI